jgi:hypothetical protein
MNQPSDPGPGGHPNWSRINQCLLWVGLAAAVAWLFFRHNEHLAQLLPFLFILACPLMHIFGHGGHGRHGGHRGQWGDAPARRGDEASAGEADQGANGQAPSQDAHASHRH